MFLFYLNVVTDIGANMEGRPNYMDERGEAYQDIESFRNRSELPEIEIQECQGKRKGNTQSPIEEERTVKVRITNRNYQMKNEEGRRRGKSREKAKRNRQEEERIESDTLQDLTYILYDQDNPMEL